MSLVVLYHT